MVSGRGRKGKGVRKADGSKGHVKILMARKPLESYPLSKGEKSL